MLRIDPHRHFGGCIPVDFIWDIIQSLGLKHLAESYEDVRRQMTFDTLEPHYYHRFLGKFKILDEIPWTETLIDKSIRAVCADLTADAIDYAWMDFSINKYMKIGWSKSAAIRFLYETFQQHRPGGVGLVLALKYESPIASQRQYARLIDDPIAEYLVGIDLVGDEEAFNAAHWKPLLKPWAAAGKMIRAHVGEFGSEANIRAAILDLGVTNIAHGIKIDSPDLIQEAKDRGIHFDLGLTSNYLTDVVSAFCRHQHPLTFMFNSGLLLTIGTDDPVVCNTTLDKEFEQATRLGLSAADCLIVQRNAIHNCQRFLNSNISNNKIGD